MELLVSALLGAWIAVMSILSYVHINKEFKGDRS